MGATPSPAGDLSVSNPLVVDEVARRHPDLVQIIAHLGHPWQRETIVTLRKNRRVYSDVSASWARPIDGYLALARAQEWDVVDKLLFGSDFPLWTPAEAVAGLREMAAGAPAGFPEIKPGDVEWLLDGDPRRRWGSHDGELAGPGDAGACWSTVRGGGNIADMAASLRGAGVALRPHFKTSKCLEVARRQLDQGAIGFTCSTPAEVGLRGRGSATCCGRTSRSARQGRLRGRAPRCGGLMIGRLARVRRAAVRGRRHRPSLLDVDTGLGPYGGRPEHAVERGPAIAGCPAAAGRRLTHEGHLGAYLADRAALEAAGPWCRCWLTASRPACARRVPCDIVSVGSTPG